MYYGHMDLHKLCVRYFLDMVLKAFNDILLVTNILSINYTYIVRQIKLN